MLLRVPSIFDGDFPMGAVISAPAPKAQAAPALKGNGFAYVVARGGAGGSKEPAVLFVGETQHKATAKGALPLQWGPPGGGSDTKRDKDLGDTAWNEAYEELGKRGLGSLTNSKAIRTKWYIHRHQPGKVFVGILYVDATGEEISKLLGLPEATAPRSKQLEAGLQKGETKGYVWVRKQALEKAKAPDWVVEIGGGRKVQLRHKQGSVPHSMNGHLLKDIEWSGKI